MSAFDLFHLLQWWLIWLFLGLAFLPLTSLIFSSFFDRGYIFAKILGALLLSYAAWLLSSLDLIPFSTVGLFLIWFAFVITNSIIAYTAHRKKDPNQPQVGWNIKVFAIEEALFATGLIFWSFVRSHEPSIHGLEKFMDYGFINSILRSDFFPPKDLWMSPLSINYYYFGHLSTAVMTKISGISADITYNLTLATLFGLLLTASFSIGANLYRFFTSHTDNLQLNAKRYTLFSGLLSAFLVTLGGNLQTIYAFFQNYPNPENPVPFWQLPFQLNFTGYWYPNATRFIPLTIHEFPIYSFVVADLHGHVLDIPFVMLLIALLVKIFHSSILHTTDYLLLGLLIAVFLMTNVLDGPIYLLLIFAVVFAMSLKHSQPALLNSLKSLGIIGVVAIVLSLPFWFAFIPFAQGIGVICAPDFLTNIGKIGPFLFEAGHCTRSPLWMLIILWGFPFFVFFGFFFYVLNGKNLIYSSFHKLTAKRYTLDANITTTDTLTVTFVIAAAILILIPEFFYAKDIYPAHWRANTVFKFGYQAFIILGLTCGYMLTRILTTKKTIPYTLYAIPLFFLFFLVAIYPYFAINSYYSGIRNNTGLDGFKYLSELYPTDYQAILWLRENIEGQPVVLEAQGDSYTDFARVSSNTGLPTVIGWPVHEWLWRGTYDEAGKRGTDVALMYESSDIAQTKALLDQYNVSFVFIGTLERQKYSSLNEEKFQSLGKLIFADDITRIYQIVR